MDHWVSPDRVAFCGNRDTAAAGAGGFLCSHVFYVLMRLLEEERRGTSGGFVHVPATLPLDLLERAARVIVAVCAAPVSTR